MRLLALAILASLGLAQRTERRSRAVAETASTIDILPERSLEERFLLSTITELTVTDGPSSPLNKSMIDHWTQTAHYAS